MKRSDVKQGGVVAAFIAALLIALSWPVLSVAQSTKDIYHLIDKGELESAMKQTSSLLKTSPDDPELLFARALITDKSGRKDQAVKLYRQLLKRHPGMLEAYNNLAIHHAANGDYKEAIDTLELALEADPAVATAYRNLTAIYAQLASAAYRKALDSSVPLEPLRLASIDQVRVSDDPRPTLVASAESFINRTLGSAAISDAIADDGVQSPTVAGAESDGTGEVTVAINSDTASISGSATAAAIETSETIDARSGSAVAAPTDTAEAGDETTLLAEAKSPAPQLKSVEVASVDDSVTRQAALDIDSVDTPANDPSKQTARKNSTPEKKPAPAKPVVVASVKPSAEARQLVEQSASEKQALIDHIKSWASAWSDRDVDRYLSHYASDFTPRNNMTLDEWKKQRYGRLRWREFIIVKPSRYNIDLDGDRATVNFNQYYKSERFEDTIRKTLKLRKRDGRWLIVRELI